MNDLPPDVLEQIKNILSEQTKDYVILAIKDDQLWTYYSSSCAAYGMLQKSLMDIEHRWESGSDQGEEY